MRIQSGIQVLLLAVAVIIAFSVVKPKIESIRDDQNELAAYRNAVENIGLYNQRLQALVNQSNAISAADRELLWRYLPEEIDATAVSRDLANIVSQNRLLLIDIVPEQAAPVTTEVMSETGDSVIESSVLVDETSLIGVLVAQQFKVVVVGTYEQMKAMMSDLERNAYPLKLIEFEFELEEASSSLVQYSFVLETYALPSS